MRYQLRPPGQDRRWLTKPDYGIYHAMRYGTIIIYKHALVYTYHKFFFRIQRQTQNRCSMTRQLYIMQIIYVRHMYSHITKNINKWENDSNMNITLDYYYFDSIVNTGYPILIYPGKHIVWWKKYQKTVGTKVVGFKGGNRWWPWT